MLRRVIELSRVPGVVSADNRRGARADQPALLQLALPWRARSAADSTLPSRSCQFKQGTEAVSTSITVRAHRVDLRLSPKQLDDIVTRYRPGESSRAIAARYGVSKHKVIELVTADAIQARHARMTDTDTAEAVEL